MLVLKWVSRIISTLLLIALGLILLFTITSKLNGGKPMIFGHEIYTVLSGSMEPTIMTGSIIAVKPVEEKEKMQVGDVITFRSIDDPNKMITHRILEVQTIDSQVQYITKGDNNDAPDTKPIPAANVVGKYANFTIPYLGYLVTFTKTKLGIILLMIIPGIILIVSQLIAVLRMFANVENQKNEESSVSATVEETS